MRAFGILGLAFLLLILIGPSSGSPLSTPCPRPFALLPRRPSAFNSPATLGAAASAEVVEVGARVLEEASSE